MQTAGSMDESDVSSDSDRGSEESGSIESDDGVSARSPMHHLFRALNNRKKPHHVVFVWDAQHGGRPGGFRRICRPEVEVGA